jgi:hypothetical protein
MATRPIAPAGAGLFPGMTPQLEPELLAAMHAANRRRFVNDHVQNPEPLPPLRRVPFDATFDDTFGAAPLPIWVVPAIITVHEKVPYGDVIKWIAPAWRALLAELRRDPSLRYQLHWRKVEEIVAAAYDAAGFHVVLTPRSWDEGSDVIATLKGIQIRILDSVKALGEGKTVPRANVDELLGVLDRTDAHKGVLTTTAEFAPGIAKIPSLQQRIASGRLQLVDGSQLVPRLIKMSSGNPFSDDE